MIVVKLMGGLGNQMFQYAIGRRLALMHGVALKLDLTFLNDKKPREHFTIRNFELNAFNIDCDFASDKEIKHFYKQDLISRIKRKFGYLRLIKEKKILFCQNVFEEGKNIYLDGYWQSEKYFEKIKSELLTEFSLNASYKEKLKEEPLKKFKELIIKTDSVSVHFRRGDYLSDETTNKFHGICSIQYYQNAIQVIAQKIQAPHFFIFTDDPEWVINNHIIKNFPSTLVTTSNMHLDMYLMSLCLHNIIANSSFSWWGAWLNQNPNKTVIAPQKWFANDIVNRQTNDLIPQNWIRL